MKFILVAAILFVVVSPNILPAREATPAKILSKLPAYVDRLMAEWKVPGLSAAVVKGDEVIWGRGFGHVPGAKLAVVSPETPFAIGSATKAFTAMGLMLLVQERKVDLDQPVASYLPGFKIADPYITANLTVRDILTHRSGIPRHDLVWFGSERSREELVKAIAFLPIGRDWRMRFQYNNLMYALAGYLTEKVSGKRWEEFIRQEVFTPLGMTHSDFSFPISERGSDNAMAPAGAIVSTVRDLSLWLRFFLRGGKAGGKTVLAEQLIAEMQTPQMVIGAFPTVGENAMTAYGLGWFIGCYRGHHMVYHDGAVKGFTSIICFLPQEKIGIAVLCNASLSPVPEVVALEALDRLLGLPQIAWEKKAAKNFFKSSQNMAMRIRELRSSQRVPGTQPSHALTEYAGIYTHPAYGEMEVRQREEGLIALFRGRELKLAHQHYDIFILQDPQIEQILENYGDIEVQFNSDLQGKICSAEVRFEPEAEPIRMLKKEPEQFTSAEYLEHFTGVYASENSDITIYVQNQTLFASLAGGGQVIELVPEKENLFCFKIQPMMKVEFQIGGKGKAMAAILIHPGGQSIAKRKAD
jgi:CubicO group peptidase (beta-lactamase class C family)